MITMVEFPVEQPRRICRNPLIYIYSTTTTTTTTTQGANQTVFVSCVMYCSFTTAFPQAKGVILPLNNLSKWSVKHTIYDNVTGWENDL